ncbi:MAG: dehydrogenase [Clostridia bacterium]|nr:dehydrogenase [Clostridia bacterium]
MPKSIFVDPKEVRKKGTLHIDDIPMNQYSETLQESRGRFTDEEMLGIFRDMYLIRVFESLLFDVKKYGKYKDISFQYDGPLHLSLGQEAAAVGQAFLLSADDLVFGSHRSHGEVLAKGFSAIRKLSEEDLNQVMEEYDDGKIKNIVFLDSSDTKTLAEDFLIYGALAEILACPTGFQQGLSGSMHAFFPPFGMYPNNAIVGASAPIAVGAALYKKTNQKPGIVLSNVGDGALGRGPVWEAMNFAAMDQFNTLWEDSYQGGLPIIFNFFNNFYGMGGQTVGETMAYQHLARIGAGISPTSLHAERVDGSNPLAVIDAMKRKIELLKAGKGPALLDVVTYRIFPHSASDHESYRTKEEVLTWIEQDPITAYHRQLVEAGVATEEKIRQIIESVDEKIDRIFALCADPAITPRQTADSDQKIEEYIYSNGNVSAFGDSVCDVLMEKAQNPRIQLIAKKQRKQTENESGITIRDAIFETILDKFYEDSSLIAYGEEVRDWGGPYGVYEGLTEALPYHRFFNSPISESAIVATAVGYAMAGGRAVVELPFCDFLGCAGDEIFNQLSKWQFMSAGHLKMPVVLRIAIGSLYGTQHAQDFTAMAAHVPGLKVIFPATPYDAKGLLTTALNGTDPVIMFESQNLYGIGEQFHSDGVPKDSYELPIGVPDIKREGKDLTILTVGASLYTAVEAADKLEEYGISAEIIDARSLVPFDYEPLIQSVRKTGRLLLIGNEVERGAFLKDIAQNVTEFAFDYLHCAPVVTACRNWIAPTTDISKNFFPSADGVLDVIHEKLLPIPCYTPTTKTAREEKLRRLKNGI